MIRCIAVVANETWREKIFVELLGQAEKEGQYHCKEVGPGTLYEVPLGALQLIWMKPSLLPNPIPQP